MPKRMIDTELWNNEQIVEEFTCDDKYFWLYLLTSPHGNICGVIKYSPIIMGRDMGLHKDTIENLIYRFENNYKLIAVDKNTKELIILNWYKWNWSTSNKLIQSIINCKETIKSEYIRELVQERIDFVIGKTDTVSIGYAYPTNTNTNTIINNKDKENSKKETETESTATLQANDENQLSIESVGIETKTNTCTTLTANNEKSDYNKVVGYFEQTWKIYPRKESKIQARTTFAHKVFTKSQTESHKLALRIYKTLERQKVVWENENNGKGRDKQYIPLFSSWLNDNFDDIPKKDRGKI